MAPSTPLHRPPALRAVALLTAAAVLSACSTSRLPPISAAGADFEPAKDEARLWLESRAEEQTLLGEAVLYEDPLLEDYLDGIAARLNPPRMAANPAVSYRVRVIADPTLNAFAYPHGSVYVHTGLLARMGSEDELATVLGHEMTHVENRHMLRYRRSARNKQIGWSVAALAAAVILAGEEGDQYAEGDWGEGMMIGVLGDLLVGLGLQLAFLASINGYGRELETEADHGSFTKLTAAGYDPAAAPAVYTTLLEDRGDPGRLEGFFFGSHPKLSARLENAESWLAAQPRAAAEDGEGAAEDGDGEISEFHRRLRPVVRDDARLNLEAGRLELARVQLDKALAWLPGDPETHLLVARLHRALAEAPPEGEGGPQWESEQHRLAEAALREAVRLDPELPAAHRELGLLAYRTDNRAAACTAFRHYLELAPDSDDAGTYRDYLLELESDGSCRPGESMRE